MSKYVSIVFWLLVCSLALQAQYKIAPKLQEAMDAAMENNSTVRAIIMLEDKFDIQSLDQQLYAEEALLGDRAYRVITALQNHAAATQGPLINFLESKSSGEVVEYQAFWIANLVAIEAAPSVVMELSDRSDVSFLQIDGELQWDEPVAQTYSESIPNGAEPGLKAINAHLMWQAGFTGAGVIVMGVDTGVELAHPAIGWKWRGNTVPADQAWFDPQDGSLSPEDCDRHGTHTIGTMQGLDPATNDTIGVAFGAEWIASKTICPGGGTHTSRSISAWQWAMDPDGDPGTHDDMPVGICNSWWDPDINTATQCDPAQNPYIAAEAAVEASGIGIVFSAGNSGSGSTSITQPKNVNTGLVNFWATGALEMDNTIAGFSSRGPVVSSCLTGDPSLDIKPEASAPGVDVRSSVLNGGYSLLSGTSMAAPHVVGALALLREAHPNRTGTELKLALYHTATDLGPVGEDNDYGMGIINVWAAHQSLADPDDPRRPTDVTAYSDYNTPNSIDLNWTDPTNYVNGDTLLNFSIEVYRDSVMVASVASGTGSYTDGGLTDGQSYRYELFAKDVNDSLSTASNASWTAGGAPTPSAPQGLTIGSSGADLVANWENPTTNVDGTAMDDLAGVNLYEDGVLLATFTRTSSDTGAADSEVFTPSAGTHAYTVTVFDDESPSNESEMSNQDFSPLSLPFADDFESGMITPGWRMNMEAEVNTAADNPPSGIYALDLNGNVGGDEVTLMPVDLSSAAGQSYILNFWVQPQGTLNNPEVEDSFFVDFLNDQSEWINVYNRAGTTVVPFEPITISLDGAPSGSGSYFYASFQFRFRTKSAPPGDFDDYFVDNVYLGIPSNDPEMTVNPLALSDTVLVGGSAAHTVAVSNTTLLPSALSYTVTTNAADSWLSVSADSGSVGAGHGDTLIVTLDASALSTGSYSSDITISGNDPNNPDDVVTVSLQVNDAPTVGLSPDSLGFTMNPGELDTLTMTIHNTGNGPLNFELSDEDISGSKRHIKPAPRPKYPAHYYGMELEKGQVDPRRGNGVTEGTGGPDAFGYTWIDSDEPGGPIYNWIDISATGTALDINSPWIPTSTTFIGNDEGYIEVPLPFSFSFYDISYNSVFIGTNGTVSFQAPAGNTFSNQMIPIAGGSIDNMLAAFWDDLEIEGAGTIYYGMSGGNFVIQYQDISRFNPAGANYTFEYILSPTGAIVYQYEAMGFSGGLINSATIGIENVDGTDGLQVAFNELYIHDGLAVKIAVGATWLDQSPVSGTVGPNSQVDVDIIANTIGLLSGDYSANVIVSSNDPLTPEARLKVNLAVTGTPAISVGPDPLIFPETIFTGTTDVTHMYVKNTGNIDLDVTDIVSDNGVFTLGQTAFTVAPFDSISIEVTFSPSAPGMETGSITVSSNDPGGDASISVEGSAVDPPIIGVDPASISEVVNYGDSVDVTLTISNTGSADLEWSASVNLFGTVPAEVDKLVVHNNNTERAERAGHYSMPPVEALGDTLFSFNITAVTPTPDMRVLGIEYALGHFWATGSDPNDINKIYQVSSDGTTLVNVWPQGTTSDWGWRDLCFDGTYLYASDSQTIQQIDPATGQATGVTIPGPLNPNRALAYDPATDHFWTVNFGSDIYEIDRAGNIINQFPNTAGAYGAAWDDKSEGGPFLWLWSQDGPVGGPECTATQVDPTTGQPTGVSFVGVELQEDPLEDDTPGGATITDAFIPGKLTFVGLHQSGTIATPGTDFVAVYEMQNLAPPWMAVVGPNSGVVSAGNSENLTLRLYGLEPDTSFNGFLDVASNDPVTGLVNVPVSLHVDPDTVGIDNGDIIPLTYDVGRNYPNPFNPTTSINYQVPEISDVSLVIYNVLGQRVKTLVNARVQPGKYQVVWDATNQAGESVGSGIYIYRFEAGDFKKIQKMILLK